MVILREGEVGLLVVEVCCKYGISVVIWYGWKSKYVGVSVLDLICMCEFEVENV